MINTKYIRRLFVFSAIAASMFLGVAQAAPVSLNGTMLQQSAAQQVLEVDVSGILNNDERGAATNIIRDFYVGAGASIMSLGWNVNVTAYEGSYLSEMQITFSDSLGNGFTFTPGNGDDFDGTTDYAGFQELGDVGQIFQVGGDGILRLEFHDYYKDLAFDEAEGIWNFGTLSVGVAAAEVPEPPSYALLLGGVLLLSGVARRRTQ